MDDDLALLREKRKKELAEKMMHTQQGVVAHVDERQFPQFIAAHRYVVVDFWAEWCGPCRRIAPVMDELAAEFAGQVTFAKCNTDENQNLARQFSIDAIPAMLLFSGGQLVDRIIGAYPREAIREKVVRRFGLE
jgi:thioredoxin 1